MFYLVFRLPSPNLTYAVFVHWDSAKKKNMKIERDECVHRISWAKWILPLAIQLRWQFWLHIFYLPDAFFTQSSLCIFTEKHFFAFIWNSNDSVRWKWNTEWVFFIFYLLKMEKEEPHMKILNRYIKWANLKWFLLATIWFVYFHCNAKNNASLLRWFFLVHVFLCKFIILTPIFRMADWCFCGCSIGRRLV